MEGLVSDRALQRCKLVASDGERELRRKYTVCKICFSIIKALAPFKNYNGMKTIWIGLVALLCAACASTSLQERLDSNLPQYDEVGAAVMPDSIAARSEEHTSELQSRENLV